VTTPRTRRSYLHLGLQVSVSKTKNHGTTHATYKPKSLKIEHLLLAPQTITDRVSPPQQAPTPTLSHQVKEDPRRRFQPAASIGVQDNCV